MRVLTVLARPPDPEGGAADRCAVALLLGLRAHGLDVRAIAPDLDGRWPAGADELGVERVAVEVPAGWRASLGHLRRPLGDLAATALGPAVRRAARDVDVLHLDRSHSIWLDDGIGLPTVMSLHHRARLDGPPDSPFDAAARGQLLLRLAERAAIRRHRWLVASSGPVARSIVRDRADADVTVVPLSLDGRRYPAARLDGPPVAGIIGTADWPPTRAAIRRLLDDVWPKVAERVPAARLRIAGRGTADLAAGPLPSGVEIVGEVASSGDFLGDLSVFLHPAPHGSGMKVKVLEAMASGVPTVTTTSGAEGLVPSDGVVISDDADDLAHLAASLLLDPEDRRSRGAAARATFERCYSPAVAVAPLVRLYERMTGPDGPRPATSSGAS